MEVKCIYCGANINENDNFCFKCGHVTAIGKEIFQDKKNAEKIVNGAIVKQSDNMLLLLSLFMIFLVGFAAMSYFRGNNLLKPILYLKKKIDYNMYGYNTSVIESKNVYNNEVVKDEYDAKALIRKDFDKQVWKCYKNEELFNLTSKLETDYDIASVNFCDISEEEINKLKDVIVKMYELFPKMKGALTNISVTNAPTKDEYIAYFQALSEFANSNNNINNYNKVNKTQILLNSYYFLNEDILNKPITEVTKENWYVKDATYESTLAHELGHYLVFKAFLKSNGLENITFVTKDNYEKINEVMEEYNTGNFAKEIVSTALKNYNSQNHVNLSLENFALSISDYAGSKDENGNVIFDETIAEAIHDYYLHSNSCKGASMEIVKIIKAKL